MDVGDGAEHPPKETGPFDQDMLRKRRRKKASVQRGAEKDQGHHVRNRRSRNVSVSSSPPKINARYDGVSASRGIFNTFLGRDRLFKSSC